MTSEDVWQQVPGAKGLASVAIVKAKQIYGVHTKGGRIFAWNGTKWERLPGSLAMVGAGKAGVWGVNAKKQVYTWSGSSWKRIPGSLDAISVGSQIWGLYKGKPFVWEGAKWSRKNGAKLATIVCGVDGDVWAIADDQDVFRYNGVAWQAVQGAPKMKSIAVGQRDFVYGIDVDGTLQQWDSASSSFVAQLPHDPPLTSISACHNHVVGLDGQGCVWIREDMNSMPGWTTLGSDMTHVSVGDRNEAWALSKSGYACHFNDSTKEWMQADTQVSGLSCGSNDVWATTDDGSVLRRTADGSGWQRMPGNMRVVAAGGTTAWGIARSGAVYQWNSRTWEPRPGSFEHLSVGRDDDVWALNGAHMAFHWNPRSRAWDALPDAPQLTSIACGSQEHVLALDMAQSLLRWDGARSAFVPLDNPYTLCTVSVSSVHHFWGVDGEGTVWRYEDVDAAKADAQAAAAAAEPTELVWRSAGIEFASVSLATVKSVWGLKKDGTIFHRLSDGSWEATPSTTAPWVHVSASRYEVWAVDANDGIHRWTGSRWQQQPGGLSHVSVGGNHVWALNRAGHIFRWTGSSWERKPGMLKQVSVGSDGEVWGITNNGSPYVWTGVTWRKMPGRLRQVSVGEAGAVYGLAGSDKLFWWNGSSWSRLPNPSRVVHLSVHSNVALAGVTTAAKVFMTSLDDAEDDVDDAMFDEVCDISDADPAAMADWAPVDGHLAQVSSNGAHTWGTTSHGAIYRMDVSSNQWQQVRGKLSHVSVGADGTVFGLAMHGGKPYKLAANDSWVATQAPASPLAVVSVGSRQCVWAIDVRGYVWHWDGLKFNQVEGPRLRHLSAAGDGSVWGLTTERALVRWDDSSRSWTGQPGPQADQGAVVVHALAVASQDTAWALCVNGAMYRWSADAAAWSRIRGAAVALDASVTQAWALGADGSIFRMQLDTEETQAALQEQEAAAHAAAVSAMGTQLHGLQQRLDVTAQAYEQRIAELAQHVQRLQADLQAAKAAVSERVAVVTQQEAELAQRDASIQRLESEVSQWKAEEARKRSEYAADDVLTWTITTWTGELPGAGTDASVTVTLEGRNGTVGPLPLEATAYDFRRGAKDVFRVRVDQDIGELRSVTLGHDNRGLSSPWLLDRVHAQNYKDDRWDFVHGGWITADTGLAVRLEPASADQVDALPRVHTYTLAVHTGDRPGASTDASVSVSLVGADGQASEPVTLDVGQLRRNTVAHVKVLAHDLGTLSACHVWHDNAGFAPGWFLDKVVVRDAATAVTTYFPCGRWLAQDEDDGKLRRELVAHATDDVTTLPLTTYTVTVITGDRRGAGTDANVSITLYGEHGASNERTLDTSANNFERKRTDVFGVTTVELGRLHKLRVAHDNTGFAPGWFLDKVIVRNDRTGADAFFLCGRWLATDEDDGAISRELAASDADGVACLPMVTYKVTVITGDRRGAGTDANVSCTLYGAKGDSGAHVLDNSGNDFERNEASVFGVEAVDLGPLRKVRIGHDDSGFGPGWFLDKVVVRNETTGEQTFFLCGQWLDKNEEDGKICRELPASAEDGTAVAPLLRYVVTTHTGDRRGAATSARVWARVWGEAGDSGVVRLENDRANFGRGRVDAFAFDAVDLGALTRLEVGHDNSGLGSGWYLDKVDVQCGDGRTWTFGCDAWLAEGEGDGAIVRELAPSPADYAPTPLCHYRITVCTGDRRAAGTGANVVVQLFGERGKSEPTLLDNASDNFARGKEDVFSLPCSDLGELTKLSIGHDASGLGSGWFLDRCEVVAESVGRTYHFAAGRWLAEDEGDGSIRCELPAADEQGEGALPVVPYKVTVITGDRRGAGTDANVSVTLYGANGDTGLRVLDAKGNQFERNQADTFTVEAVDLGQLTKLRIGHDNAWAGSAWFLDKVVVRHPDTDQAWYFLCGRWLATGEDDGALVRELPSRNEDGQSYAPVTHYKVTVHTADRRGAGTNARVTMRVTGDKGESDEIRLDGGRRAFERGSVDVFGFEAVDLGDLTKVRIGHDGSGFAPGWLLDKVVVYCELGARQWYFLSGQWFAADEGDGATVRELPAAASDGSGVTPLHTYHIDVHTADVRYAGTSADVTLMLQGTEGDTGDFVLECKDGFGRGSVRTFKHEAADLGSLEKLRIGHNNAGIGPGWLLDKVVVRDEATATTTYFLCGRWLAEDEDDGAVVRELPAADADGQTYLPETLYTVTVKTGDRHGAGTRARVWLEVHGEHGDTGRLMLENGRQTFDRNAQDVFRFRAVSVGQVTKVLIGHDGSADASWFLEKLTLRAEDLGQETYFLHGRWLAADCDDHQLQRLLLPAEADGVACAPLVTYEVTVVTSDVRGAGTNANVHMTLFGANGDTGSLCLDNAQDNFERGKRDVFLVEAVDLGDLKRLRIGHDGAGAASGWHLAKVMVRDMRRNQCHYFVCNQWLDTSSGDGKRERDLGCSLDDTEVDVPTTVYRITAATGDVSGAGTNATVRLVLTGDNGHSRDLVLDTKGSTFVRNQVDTFYVECVELGPLRKARVWHDGRGPGAGWFLVKLTAEPVESEDDAAPSTGPKMYFHCNRWLAADEDDAQTVRELGASATDEPSALPSVHYRVRVVTGDVRGAGTNATVSITLYGANGDSGLRRLDPAHGWERGSVNEFSLELIDLGELTKLRIGHDDSGVAPGWFLDKVEVQAGTGQSAFFLAGRWFASDEDDGATSRELVAATEDADTYAPETTYVVTTHTGDRFGAGTNASVFIELFGASGKSGEHRLDNAVDNFERRKTDVFGVVCQPLGPLTKVRVRCDGAGLAPAWFLDKVVVHCEGDGSDAFFLHGDWLSRKQGLTVELAASDADGVASSAMVDYKLTVITGDRFGAGTNANVWAQLYGEAGDTREVLLDNRGNDFERNTASEFTLPAVDLGALTKLRLRSDDAGIASDWFLDKCVVSHGTTGKQTYFLCGKWFATGREDGQLQRELPASGADGQACAPMQTYTLSVTTGDRRGAGTRANVWAQVYGAGSRDSGRIDLTLRGGHVRNRTAMFRVECVDLGELTRLHVGHDGRGLGDGWFLDKVVVRAGDGQTWYFLHGRWLASDEDDHQLERDLTPNPVDGVTYEPMVNYKVTLVTADRPGAGTNANVFLTLVGEAGVSPEFPLDNDQNNFERGKKDVFALECVSVGRVTKVRVRHDGHGLASGWLLDKVIVYDERAQLTRYCVCGQWLAKGEADGQLMRELPAGDADGSTLLPLKTYTVTVVTGNRRGAGTNANVFVDVTGANGNTGPRRLDNARNNFERDHTDTFQLQAVDLGALSKLRLWHDNAGVGPGWFVDKVIVTDDATKAMSYFMVGRWLADDEGDRQISIEVAAQANDGVACAPLVTYRVTVVTADRRGAGTNARVTVNLFGDLGATGARTLDGSFERGSVDHFGLQAVDLGSLTKIQIGHDNRGFFPAWFLEKVTIRNECTGHEWYFLVGRELDADNGDKRTRIEVQPSNADGQAVQPLVTYRLTITTADRRGAGTDANVSVTLYGDKLVSRTLDLDAPRGSFARGAEAVFGVDHVDLGVLRKLRIGHDDSGWASGWLLDKVVVRNLKSGEEWYFLNKQWLATDEGDGQVVRELPASMKDGTALQQFKEYQVTVHTGDRRGAATNADVSITLYGDLGDTGARALEGRHAFRRGATDVFGLEAVDLGTLSKIRIGHNAKHLGSAWFLDKVVVEDTVTHQHAYFLVGRWLDKYSGDNKVVLDVAAQTEDGQACLPTALYTLTLYTPDISGAGTHANLWVTLYGKDGDSGRLELDNDHVKRNSVEAFDFELVDLGQLSKLTIGSDNRGRRPGWLLEKAVVKNERTGVETTFPSGVWWTDEEQLVRDLMPGEESVSPITRYEVSVFTGNVRSGGTDANVFCEFYGTKGTSGRQELAKSGNSFERGDVDVFDVKCKDVGELIKVRIGHDNKWRLKASWFLDQVQIKSMRTDDVWSFPCSMWLDKGSGDHQIVRELPVAPKASQH